MTMRLGLFGGSFDPVHNGHLELANCCCQQLGLDEVRFLPAANQPLKPAGPYASGDDRLSMVRLAADQHPKFVASDREIARGGTSFTVDTLREIASELPGAALFLLLGADALADLPTWKNPQEICRLATPVAVSRAGSPEPDFFALKPLVSADRWEQIRAAQVHMPAMAVSSSEIRERIAQGRAWEDLAPRQVAEFIRQRKLYQ